MCLRFSMLFNSDNSHQKNYENPCLLAKAIRFDASPGRKDQHAYAIKAPLNFN